MSSKRPPAMAVKNDAISTAQPVGTVLRRSHETDSHAASPILSAAALSRFRRPCRTRALQTTAVLAHAERRAVRHWRSVGDARRRSEAHVRPPVVRNGTVLRAAGPTCSLHCKKRNAPAPLQGRRSRWGSPTGVRRTPVETARTSFRRSALRALAHALAPRGGRAREREPASLGSGPGGLGLRGSNCVPHNCRVGRDEGVPREVAIGCLLGTIENTGRKLASEPHRCTLQRHERADVHDR